MFKEISQIAGLLKQAPRIKEEMEKFQQKLGQITADGDAGGGMVKVKVNGRMEILNCAIADETMSDKELLEDLIKGAVNQALTKVRQLVAEEGSKLAGGLGISNLPDLSGMMGKS